MTIFVPLGRDASSAIPATPSFLVPSSSNDKLGEIVKAVTKARRIIVVSGAGISVEAGIPDFRSSNGLFTTVKRENPKENLSSGKDLFDASVFHTEQKASLFYQMIAHLSDLSSNATPTPFHSLLRTLDTKGRLLRLYTQNIDALEEKAGLSFGVPSFEERPRSKRAKLESDVIVEGSTMKAENLPKCIPLHGTLQKMHCSLCSHSYPLAPYVSTLRAGSAPFCPSCSSLETTRELVGKRLRGVGRLRPSVVLYGEVHREGEGVGEVVRRDLVGKGTGKGKGNKGGDLLIVVGTSLRVPGTKRIVREFSKSVKTATPPKPPSTPHREPLTPGHLPSPAPSPRRSPVQNLSPAPDRVQPIRTIFINYDFPLPSREWEGIFDVWVKGNAQEFAELVSNELEARERLNLAKRRKSTGEIPSPMATPQKRKREGGSGKESTAKTKRKTDQGRNAKSPVRKTIKRSSNTSNPFKATPLTLPKSNLAFKNNLFNPVPPLIIDTLSPIHSPVSPLSPTSSIMTRSRSCSSSLSVLTVTPLGEAAPSPTFSDTPLSRLLPSPSLTPPPTPTPIRRRMLITPEIHIPPPIHSIASYQTPYLYQRRR